MFFRYVVLSLMLCSFCHYEQWMVCRYCCRTYHLKGTNYSDRSSDSAEHWIHFTATCDARLHWFLVGQISRNLNITRWSESRWILSEQNFENFPVRGHCSKKTLNFRKNVNVLRLQAAITPKWLQIVGNSLPRSLCTGCLPVVSIFTVGINSEWFPWPLQSTHRE